MRSAHFSPSLGEPEWFQKGWPQIHLALPFLGPGNECVLEKAMAAHSSTLTWEIPWTEEPGRLQSMGSQRVIQLSDFTFTIHFHALEKEMATHPSVLAWRIPGMAEPGGLPVGSHRVGHDWCDLAAAAAMSVSVTGTLWLLESYLGNIVAVSSLWVTQKALSWNICLNSQSCD